MTSFFALLFLVSLLGLLIGMLSPETISKLIRLQLSRGKIAGLFSGLILLSLIGIGASAPPTPSEDTSMTGDVAQSQPKNEAPQLEPQVSIPSDEPAEPEPTINFSIIHEVQGKRYDGGTNYYVLIDPVDLSNDGFKTKVKTIISEIVEDKGKKISVEIHDNKAALEVSYKLYGDNSLGRPTTAQEDEEQAKHQIAAFSGELETGLWPNTLMFFPATDANHPVVGKYVEFKEWSP